MHSLISPEAKMFHVLTLYLYDFHLFHVQHPGQPFETYRKQKTQKQKTSFQYN